ncbi:MarR family winged helix-turn-helix transcriptional regulator [Streptomyces sp. NPDC059708]|uniref:MarR family winged helix-turn-helix transcriptional regulator n=1 Tax=Streptomyces sp. NPDC059708 TaxID=3346916 RepID=UPI0036C0C058
MDDNHLELVHLLREVTIAFGLRQAEFAAAHGMHPTDVRALVCLLDAARAAEPATAGILGARLGLNSAGTTAVIDRLERLGHVTRTRDPHDRRRVLLSVTPEATRLGRAFFGPAIEALAGATASLGPTEREAVRGFLTTARAAFGDGGATGDGA